MKIIVILMLRLGGGGRRKEAMHGFYVNNYIALIVLYVGYQVREADEQLVAYLDWP